MFRVQVGYVHIAGGRWSVAPPEDAVPAVHPNVVPNLEGMMSQTLSLIEEWCAAWSDHDMARVTTVFTSDSAYEDVSMGLVHHGHEELTRFAFLQNPASASSSQAAAASRPRGRCEGASAPARDRWQPLT